MRALSIAFLDRSDEKDRLIGFNECDRRVFTEIVRSADRLAECEDEIVELPPESL